MTRWAGASAIFGAFLWLVLLLFGDRRVTWDPEGRFVWSLALLTSAAFISRGILRSRPVTIGHAAAAGSLIVAGTGAHIGSFPAVGDLLIASAGFALMRPTRALPQPDAIARIWTLVSRTHGDPLAPFAMQRQKSFHFSVDGTAAIAYRTMLGFAVVSGDPIGDARRSANWSRISQANAIAADGGPWCWAVANSGSSCGMSPHSAAHTCGPSPSAGMW